ncbi:cysteine peptidase C11 family protein [Fluviicoccus keumensis]|uniref:Cysteine peptidase C11 family protein n=2 Tax=Fluviicoccus keumensis TaxID=1435465 RepID=A0A4Q7ZAA4_9GAMM|nr:cysteine peptidase C11 family protein [Fluviicoccus keumensis]
MHFVFRAICLMLVSLLLASCGGGGGDPLAGNTPSPTGEAEWTYMVYIAGDNNLSASAIADINEMEAVGSSAKVNVVVQAEFSPQYTPNVPGVTKSSSRDGIPLDILNPILPTASISTLPTVRGRITKDADPAFISSTLNSMGSNLDMGKPETLTAFIQWAKQTYPAKHYALVLWSHGDGWKVRRSTGGLITRGALADDTSGSFMSVPDIAKAIRDSGVPISVLDFDACLMSMYEVAHAFIGLVDYMAASEEVEPGDGDDYQSQLAQLQARPDMSAVDLAKTTVTAYRQFYATGSARSDAVTKSVLHIPSIPALQDTVEAFARYAADHINDQRVALQAARAASVAYENKHSHDLVDFLDQLSAQTSVKADPVFLSRIDDVRQAVKNTVVDNQFYAQSAVNPIGRSRGIAIFLPSNSQITQDELLLYDVQTSNLNGKTAWHDFVNLMVSGDTGAMLEKVPGNFAFTLRWDDPAVDLDLYVYEPEDLYAPYMGVRTPNGFFTPDSSESGLAMEGYVADEQVQKGDYEVYVNYYSGAKPTTANLFYADASTAEHQVGSLTLPVAGLAYAPAGSSPLNDAGIAAGSYADWWFPGGVTRSLGGASISKSYRLPNGKTVVVRFNERRAKLKRMQAQRRTGASS